MDLLPPAASIRLANAGRAAWANHLRPSASICGLNNCVHPRSRHADSTVQRLGGGLRIFRPGKNLFPARENCLSCQRSIGGARTMNAKVKCGLYAGLIACMVALASAFNAAYHAPDLPRPATT